VQWPLFRVAVAERSMEPALMAGDWLLVIRCARIRAGHIVIARNPEMTDMLLVKRAGRRVDGGWWLESDNPGAGAVDSRRFGPVPDRLVIGRVLARYWPLRRLCRTAARATRRARGTGRSEGANGRSRSRAA
jgi:nickel-type superoxide dismutase maturation protease